MKDVNRDFAKVKGLYSQLCVEKHLNSCNMKDVNRDFVQSV